MQVSHLWQERAHTEARRGQTVSLLQNENIKNKFKSLCVNGLTELQKLIRETRVRTESLDSVPNSPVTFSSSCTHQARFCQCAALQWLKKYSDPSLHEKYKHHIVKYSTTSKVQHSKPQWSKSMSSTYSRTLLSVFFLVFPLHLCVCCIFTRWSLSSFERLYRRDESIGCSVSVSIWYRPESLDRHERGGNVKSNLIHEPKLSHKCFIQLCMTCHNERSQHNTVSCDSFKWRD